MTGPCDVKRPTTRNCGVQRGPCAHAQVDQGQVAAHRRAVHSLHAACTLPLATAHPDLFLTPPLHCLPTPAHLLNNLLVPPLHGAVAAEHGAYVAVPAGRAGTHGGAGRYDEAGRKTSASHVCAVCCRAYCCACATENVAQAASHTQLQSPVGQQLHLQVARLGRQLHGKDGRAGHLALHLLEHQPHVVVAHDLRAMVQQTGCRIKLPKGCRWHTAAANDMQRAAALPGLPGPQDLWEPSEQSHVGAPTARNSPCGCPCRRRPRRP